MMQRIAALAMVLTAVFLCVPLVTPAQAQDEMIVSAAASLTNAFEELGAAYEKAAPGAKITFNFAASGALLQQIDKGAPVDVLVTADQKTMDQAQQGGHILPETRKNFVRNEMVLIVPTDSKAPVKNLKDLSAKEVTKVSLGNPDSVPAGRYAKEVLIADKLWEPLAPKFILGNSVRQVLDYVSRGEVDAGLVYSTDAVQAKDKVKVVCMLDKHQPILYAIATVKATKKKEAAQRFENFVMSEAGQGILARYGFLKP